MTRTVATTLSLLAVGACHGAAVDEDSGLTEDTAIVDPGEPGCDRFKIVGDVVVPAGAQLPAGEVSVDIAWVDLTGDGFEAGAVQDIDTVGVLTADGASFELCVDAVPSPQDLYVADELNPDFVIASYVIRGFEDDGTGGASSWVGASVPTVLIYADSEPPQGWLDLGLVRGWNRLDLDVPNDSAAGTPLASGDQVDLEAGLLYRSPHPLTGSVTPDLSASTDLVVGAYHVTNWIDSTVPPVVRGTLGAEPLTVGVANANFAFAAPLPKPPADHLAALVELPYVDAGIYLVAAWEDTNSSLSFEPGEPMLANSLASDSARSLVFLEATDWRASFYLAQGMQMGWNLSEADAVLAWSTGVVLAAQQN